MFITHLLFDSMEYTDTIIVVKSAYIRCIEYENMGEPRRKKGRPRPLNSRTNLLVRRRVIGEHENIFLLFDRSRRKEIRRRRSEWTSIIFMGHRNICSHFNCSQALKFQSDEWSKKNGYKYNMDKKWTRKRYSDICVLLRLICAARPSVALTLVYTCTYMYKCCNWKWVMRWQKEWQG